MKYVEAEIDDRYLLRFIELCLKIMHRKFQFNLTKIKGVKVIFFVAIFAMMAILVQPFPGARRTGALMLQTSINNK